MLIQFNLFNMDKKCIIILFTYTCTLPLFIQKTITKNESLDFWTAIHLFIMLRIDSPVPLSQEKITDSHFWIFLGIWRIPIKIPNLAKWDKSQPANSQPSSLIGTCLTLPNLGFLWVFFKYPKISKNGNQLFFPVIMGFNC